MKSIIVSSFLIFIIFQGQGQVSDLKYRTSSKPEFTSSIFSNNKQPKPSLIYYNVAVIKSISNRNPLFLDFNKQAVPVFKRLGDPTAGNYLVKARNRAITAIVLGITGPLVSGIGSVLYSYDYIGPLGFLAMTGIGGGLAFTGFCFNISAWNQIGKAGRALNN